MPAVDSFLRTVLRSGLLDKEQLQDAVRAVPRAERHDAVALANHLIRLGKLSRFQANKLLRGTPLGLVLGPFHVQTPIGRGGMGTVYLARDVRSNLLVALKVLPPKRAKEEERLLARFRREMELCQRVAHPHLAWTYEVGVCQGVYYIAMEYIPGRSLYRVVVDDGPLAVPRAARLFAEVASALDHAHAQGLIHRDLKPSNIIITPHDHAKVLDLGLALQQGEDLSNREVVGGQGYVVGSWDYIAPEQTENATGVDPRSDIYSLGCTLYFALTGRPPFPGGTSREKIRRHRNDEPVPISYYNPDAPPGFIDLVRRMTAKKPDERPATAHELRAELLRWAACDGVLPLDRQEDPEYQQAVASLEAEEAPPELAEEAVPVETTEPCAPRAPTFVLADLGKPSPAVAAEPMPWANWVALAGMWVMVFLTLVALAVMLLIRR
jgi:eukaryotic-like serine/threonine-protein kinase